MKQRQFLTLTATAAPHGMDPATRFGDKPLIIFCLCSPTVCEIKDVCPPWKDPDSGYVAQHAEACSYDAMLPTGFELDSGKRFSCECRSATCCP